MPARTAYEPGRAGIVDLSKPVAAGYREELPKSPVQSDFQILTTDLHVPLSSEAILDPILPFTRQRIMLVQDIIRV